MHGEEERHSFIYFSRQLPNKAALHHKTAFSRTKAAEHLSLILITLQVLYRMNQAKAMIQECNYEFIKPGGEQRREAH
ncbi:transposase [Enterobacter mori]